MDDLQIQFRTPQGPLRAVNGVSFTLEQGETLAIVGESGCGKSATALSLTRLLPAAAATVTGSIRFQGDDLLSMAEEQLREIRGRHIAMVFQDPMSSLNPVRNIGVQMEEMLRLHLRLGRRQARERSVELLASVGIPSPARQMGAYPHQLSGGMRQRVMIAMALSCEPQILVADEPTTALDVSIQAQILELLRRITEVHRTSLILVSHDLSVVAGLADRIAVMYAGEIVESGPTGRVFAHPRHPYTLGLLGCIPRLDVPRTDTLRSIDGVLPDPHIVKVGCPFAPRCSFVMKRCASDAPTLETKAPGQVAACWADLAEVRRDAAPGLQVRSADTPGHFSPDPDALVKVQELKVHFRLGASLPLRPRAMLRAVDGVSFEVPRGQTLGIVGESGCGKSTTGRALLRLVEPTSGHIFFEGRELASLGAEELRGLRPRMQMVFQDPYSSLNPRLSVGDAVGEPLVVHRAPERASLRGRVAELLDMVGLPAQLANRFPHQLSGGQRQRVSIARALALRPSLIVADEPTSALDVSVRAQILNLLRELQDTHRLTYVFISHDLSIVRHMSNLVAVMYLGKVVEIADRDTLYANPQHPYTQALLAVVPVPDPAVERDRRRVPIRGDVPNPAAPPHGCRFNTRCPLAFDRCFQEEPPLAVLSRGHSAACFLAKPQMAEASR
ncbi:MAG TPA: ABC transporter ATP-binding protein [Candidatus Dormibacteraeota bacterium]|nr:ABC transporter ATP-binding protein [Candidatus Dormibacteraeota bacterium]